MSDVRTKQGLKHRLRERESLRERERDTQWYYNKAWMMDNHGLAAKQLAAWRVRCMAQA